MMPKNELVTSEEDAFALAAELRDLVIEDAGRGSENVTANDMAIPYLGIIQKMSPEVDEASPEYLPTARPGMIYQNLNKILWARDEGVLVVPCAYDRKIIEWVPREAGGGLVAIHELSTPLLADARPNEKKIPTLPNGHNLIDTSAHFVLYQNPMMGWEPAIISMKSTAQKKSRLWNALIAQQLIPETNRVAPRWLFIWRLTTAIETKDQNTWYNWEIGRHGIVSKDIYVRGKTLNEQFRSGSLAADAAAATAAAGKGLADDEIPF